MMTSYEIDEFIAIIHHLIDQICVHIGWSIKRNEHTEQLKEKETLIFRVIVLIKGKTITLI